MQTKTRGNVEPDIFKVSFWWGEIFFICYIGQIFQDFSEIDVDIYMAGCQGKWTPSYFIEAVLCQHILLGFSLQPLWWNN